MSETPSLSSQYAKAMIKGDALKCFHIEQDNGLAGYPPELVSVALKAIDEGRDPDEALADYMDGNDEEDHTA